MYECIALMADGCQARLHHLLQVPAGSLLMLGAVYLAAAILSGLSGFGFSAVGSLSLLVLPPQLGVALLMGLSLIGQLASYRSLWSELRDAHDAAGARRHGAWPYLLGGCLGLPAGLYVLSGASASKLIAGLGVFLVSYAAWSLLKPDHLRLRASPRGPWAGLTVGALGGLVGGFSAFPGAVIVVWSGLIGLPKAHTRALTAPFILGMQVLAFLSICLLWPERLGPTFWGLMALSTPLVLLGNRYGVAMYRRTGDMGYRRVTLAALGVSGIALLMKTV
jgi:uncharacterized membrane protein YfcA